MASARKVLAGAVLAAAAAGSAQAGAVWIEASRDTTLIEDPAGAASNGSGPYFFAGRNSGGSLRRALIAFDLEGKLPKKAEIIGARLVLHMDQTSGGPTPMSLHRVIAAWGEGASSASGGQGAPSAEGDATWIHTAYAIGFWAEAGGDAVASSASTLVDQPQAYAVGPTTEMIEDVRRWIADPSSNQGWMLRGDESQPTTTKRFASRENPDADLRPVLILEYDLPGKADDEVPDARPDDFEFLRRSR